MGLTKLTFERIKSQMHLQTDGRKGVPWCMTFVDDVILIRNNVGCNVDNVLLVQRTETNALEREGLRISRNKTECMFTNVALVISILTILKVV